MDQETPESADDAALGPDPARDEAPTERLDRNWEDLLQELRVVQTGVQLLTGFLLTLPFQTRFTDVEDLQRNAYLTTVACAIAATGFLIAPASLHRLVFRRHLRRRMVTVAHYLALIGMALLALRHRRRRLPDLRSGDRERRRRDRWRARSTAAHRLVGSASAPAAQP